LVILSATTGCELNGGALGLPARPEVDVSATLLARFVIMACLHLPELDASLERFMPLTGIRSDEAHCIDFLERRSRCSRSFQDAARVFDGLLLRHGRGSGAAGPREILGLDGVRLIALLEPYRIVGKIHDESDGLGGSGSSRKTNPNRASDHRGGVPKAG